MPKQFICFLSLLFLSYQVRGETRFHGIDSMKRLIQNEKKDSNRVKLILNLNKYYHDNGQYDSVLFYSKAALALSQKIKFHWGIIHSNYNISESLYWQSDFSHSIEQAEIALKFAEPEQDFDLVVLLLRLIGDNYFWMSKYPIALKYYLKALKMAEPLPNKKPLAGLYNSLGWISDIQGNETQALDYYFKSLAISRAQQNINGIIATTGNIGKVYSNQKKYTEATKYFKECSDLSLKYNYKYGLQSTYLNWGSVYLNQKINDSAIIQFNKALVISQETQEINGMMTAYIALGKVHHDNKNYRESEKALLKAHDIAVKTGSIKGLLTISSLLSDVYEKTNRLTQALSYYKDYKNYQDSILNETNNKEINALKTNYAVDKRETELKAIQEKKDILIQQELHREKLLRNSIGIVFLMLLGFLIVVYRQRNKISAEKKRSDELLLNILPEEVAEELKNTGIAKAKSFEQVTVLFTDFKNFTQASEKMSAEDLVHEINLIYSRFDLIMAKYNIEKIKTIGDSYMCAGGLPSENKTNPIDCIRAAIEIRDFIKSLEEEKRTANKVFFEIRIGINTGSVVAGIVGIKKFAYDIWGDTVNIASRMESSGEAGKINISGSTYEEVKHEFHCTYRGKIEVKGKGEIDMYFVDQ